MRNKLLILLVFVIVLLSFFLPKWLFEIEDLKAENQLFSVVKPKSKMDVQAEKIYLVKAIHDMSEGNRNVLISQKQPVYGDDHTRYAEVESTEIIKTVQGQEENEINRLKSELSKLENGKVLKALNIDANFASYDIEVGNFMYSNQESQYEIKQFCLESEMDRFNLEIEDKTGKILYLLFPKEKLCEDREIEEILQDYIGYLDLYIIDDWTFENNLLKSEKAQLVVSLIQNEKEYLLSIQTMTKYSKYYEIVESAK